MASASKDKLLTEFDSHCKGAKTVSPYLSYENMLAIWEQSGELIERFLAGKSKKWFLTQARNEEKRYQLLARQFFVLSLDDLFECLLQYTNDWDYAAGQKKHEGEHAKLVANFRPTNGDKRPEVMYSVAVLSDRHVIPYTVFFRRVLGQSPLVTCRQSPLLLYEEWADETLRAWFRFLRVGATDGSEGDRLILRN